MAQPTLDTLETPAALVDVERVEVNLARVAAYTRAHGLAWRPHTKTHKTAELAARQLAAGAQGLSVATPLEAEVMAQVSDDLLFAYPPVGEARLARLMALPARVRLGVALDSHEALAGLSRAAQEAGRGVGVLVELDLGMRRVGVQTPDEAVALARAIRALPALTYRGVAFYPGHIRARTADQDAALAHVSSSLHAFLQALCTAGLEPGVVSGGSTPTLWRSHEVAGLTELRAGINVLNDRNTALLGACAWEEVAYSVLATVVSTAVPGQAVVDAGSKALAKEEPPVGTGYGAVLERPEVPVRALSEEHGLLDLTHSAWRPRVGERVRLVPNHVCASVALHDALWAVQGSAVRERWEVAARGWTGQRPAV